MKDYPPTQKEQWFNDLPFTRHGVEFERVCVCGESIRYDWHSTEPVKIQSWIDIHFEHQTAQSEKKKQVYVYDSTVPWKFTREGFLDFAETFNLKTIETKNGIRYFTDKFGNELVFGMPEEIIGIWAQFFPSLSKIKTKLEVEF